MPIFNDLLTKNTVPKNNILGRFIDHVGANMSYNSYEAQRARDFNAEQALLSRNFNAAEAEKNRQFQSAEALANRRFQEHMSNTAWQRAIEDGRKAGINPYIALQSASTPTGSFASGYGATSTPVVGQAASYAGASNAQSYASIINSVSNLVKQISDSYKIIKIFKS